MYNETHVVSYEVDTGVICIVADTKDWFVPGFDSRSEGHGA